MTPINTLFWSFLFPFCSILWAKDVYINGEGVPKTVTIVAPLIACLGSSAYACLVAYKMKFYAYRLNGAKDVFSTLVGGVFFWCFYFPSFLNNYYLVKNKKIEKHTEESLLKASQNFRVIFAIIIWNTLWFMPALQIIPSVTSRTMIRQAKQNDYSSAVEGLKSYYNAQVIFNSPSFKVSSGISFNSNGYCDNFRNLYYGLNADRKPIEILPKEIADAFIGRPCGLPTMGDGEKHASRYKNFFYKDDPYICVNNLWDNQFGFYAIPATIYDGTSKLLWIGVDNVIMCTSITMDDVLNLSAEDSPRHPSCRRRWEPYINSIEDVHLGYPGTL